MTKLPPHLQHLYDTKQYAALRSALEELAGDALSRADWDAHDRIMKQLRAVQKLIVPLFALCLLFASCNQNEPNRGGDSSLNQPSDPASWSPVGKRYVRDRSAEKVNGNDYFYEVVWFKSSDSAIWYNSIVADYTQMNQTYPCAYIIEYPNATLTFFEVNHDKYYFTDTLTFHSANSSGAFILAN